MYASENIFQMILLITYILGWILRYNYTRQTRNNRIIKSVRGKQETIMYRLGVIVYLLPFVYALTSWLDFA
jgi:hypothetical protein